MTTSGATFTRNFNDALASKLDRHSAKEIADRIGTTPGHLSKIRAGYFDNSKDGPGGFLVARAAQELGTTPNELLGFETPPTTASFFAAFASSKRKLEAFSHLLEYADLYLKPENNRTFIESAGRLSVLATEAETTDTAILQAQYHSYNTTTRRSIYKAHKQAWNDGHSISDAHFNTVAKSTGRPVRVTIIRSSFRLTRPDGEQRLLVFAERVAQNPLPLD